MTVRNFSAKLFLCRKHMRQHLRTLLDWRRDRTAQICAPFDVTRKPPLSAGILDGDGIFVAVLPRICFVPDATGSGADELNLVGPMAGQL